MHMADALISNAVAGTMTVVTVGTCAYSIRKIKDNLDDKKIPLMAVMGAFIFAAQMINFTIPGTGSSGHIGGGLLLAILLGPYAAFITLAVVLLIQALLFADGGLLAFGCNVFNLGFYTCFVAYPLFKHFVKNGYNKKKIVFFSIISAIIGLQLGAFSVVIETLLSGKTELPFSTFVLWMQPIHLAIGIVEGMVTASVVLFILRTRPEIIDSSIKEKSIGEISVKKVILFMGIITVLVGGLLSWFASSNPDGLEWSMFKTAGVDELVVKNTIFDIVLKIQEKISLLPDYSFKGQESQIGTSTSGIVGSLVTFALILITGITLRFVKKRISKNNSVKSNNV